MIVVAGPPGSGKTTCFPVTAFGIDGFNIDDRCAQLQGSYAAISRRTRAAVSKECEQFVLRHITDRQSFAVETTLRTLVAVEQADLARKNGFLTVLRYVATSRIEENVDRITQRAQAGGHGAAESDIRGIHHASLRNLPRALQVFDLVRVYDATARWEAPRLIGVKRGGTVTVVEPVPAWFSEAVAQSRN